VVNAIGIRRYESYDDGLLLDIGCIARDFKADQDAAEQTVWNVVVEYDSTPFQPGGSPRSNQSGGSPNPNDTNANTNPEARAWTYSFGSTKYTEVCAKDINGKAVVASNDQPFEGGLEVPYANPTVQITGYKLTFDFGQIDRYTNSVNNKTYLGYAAHRWKCTEYRATNKVDNGIQYWQLDITLELKAKSLNNASGTWTPVQVLDCGTIKKITRTMPDGSHKDFYEAITDGHGQPVHAPVPLDGSGGQLAPGGDKVYLGFDVLYEADFTNLI
jgi:hypothetical protein